MSMRRDSRLFPHDILDSIALIRGYPSDVFYDEFALNPQLQDSVARRLEIIGKAARALPRDLREAHPEVPWIDIVGMRNILIHEYHGASLERVWEVVQQDLDTLEEQVQAALQELGDA